MEGRKPQSESRPLMAKAPASPLAARAKLADVAHLAKVSLATASRALNQPAMVRPEIRERVLVAVQMLGYTPDRMAKALSSGRSHTVGAVVPTLGNAIFADGVEALQERLGERGYTLLLAHSQYRPDREFLQVKAMIEHGVDGLVLVGDTFAAETMPLIRSRNVAAVTTYVCTSRNNLPAIGIDNRQAAYEATRHVLSLGHHEFAVIANTSLPNDRSQARMEGMLQAIAEEGIRLTSSRIVEAAQPTITSGREAFDRLRKAHPSVTAYLCTTDAMAVGVVTQALRAGLRVPRDISVIGFDDVEIAAEIDPPLTTVRVPTVEIGTLAADHLIGLIEGIAPPLTTRLDASLVIRGSTAAAPSLRAPKALGRAARR
ncbi:MAG: substrate-binding domain-containing protein [Rhizobiales bacterium]|nr:substrate-binding domain-containing protein [Hyphomicrobiales bacterium]